MPDGARCGAKGGSGFAFTVAGKDDQNTSLLCSRRHAGINLRFQLLLALTVAVGISTRVHKPSLMPRRAGCAAMLMLELAEEVIAFIVDQHKRRQVIDFHHPHRFHPQLRILKAA